MSELGAVDSVTTVAAEHVWHNIDSGLWWNPEPLADWLAARDRAVAERVWDERSRAKSQFLGPDNGHEYDCMGWEDCWCASYPNPYRTTTKTPNLSTSEGDD